MPDMLSIVIPVYNEQESLEKLHAELAEVARRAASTIWRSCLSMTDRRDDSWEVIEQLAQQRPARAGHPVSAQFWQGGGAERRFRSRSRADRVHHGRRSAGRSARDPAFSGEMDNGWDVVSGWKKVRHDPWHKVGPSRVFNWLVGAMTGVRLHDHNCGFKCYRREVVQEVHLYGEMHRFVPVLAAARGWKVGEIVVHHRAREFGHPSTASRGSSRDFWIC